MEKMGVDETKKPAATEPAQKEESKAKPAVKYPRKGKPLKRDRKAKKETRKEPVKTEEKSAVAVTKPEGKKEEEDWEDEDNYPGVKLSELLSDLTLNDTVEGLEKNVVVEVKKDGADKQ